MAALNKTPWMLIFFVVIGGLFGGLLGEVLRTIAPDGPLQVFFSKAYGVGIDPPLTLDLRLVTMTLGFTLRISVFNILGILLGIYVYKQA